MREANFLKVPMRRFQLFVRFTFSAVHSIFPKINKFTERLSIIMIILTFFIYKKETLVRHIMRPSSPRCLVPLPYTILLYNLHRDFNKFLARFFSKRCKLSSNIGMKWGGKEIISRLKLGTGDIFSPIRTLSLHLPTQSFWKFLM